MNDKAFNMKYVQYAFHEDRKYTGGGWSGMSP